MEKVKNRIGLSPDFIIHPGETLAEVLEERNMTQRELALRTGVSEKHVSTVVNGEKSITASFARKLEYALGIETMFWVNLQANYDRELLEYEEKNNISQEELRVLDSLDEIITTWIHYGWLEKKDSPKAMLVDLRMLFGMSNLLDTPKIAKTKKLFSKKGNDDEDVYVLFAQQRTQELLSLYSAVLPNSGYKK